MLYWDAIGSARFTEEEIRLYTEFDVAYVKDLRQKMTQIEYDAEGRALQFQRIEFNARRELEDYESLPPDKKIKRVIELFKEKELDEKNQKLEERLKKLEPYKGRELLFNGRNTKKVILENPIKGDTILLSPKESEFLSTLIAKGDSVSAQALIKSGIATDRPGLSNLKGSINTKLKAIGYLKDLVDSNKSSGMGYFLNEHYILVDN